MVINDLDGSQSQIMKIKGHLENAFEEGTMSEESIDAAFSTQIDHEMEEIIDQEEVSIFSIF